MKSKFAILFLSALTIICSPVITQAVVKSINPATDCGLLSAPNTIVIVHASWCYYCRKFLPVVKAVSELPQYKSWTFYEIQDDDDHEVCGKTPEGFPSLYLRNKDRKPSSQVGYLNENELKQELDDANRPSDYSLPLLIGT